LGFFDDVKKGIRQVANTGRNVVNQAGNVIDQVGNGWEKAHPQSYNQYGQQVFDMTNNGLQLTDDVLRQLQQFRGQQQLQQLGFFKSVKNGLN